MQMFRWAVLAGALSLGACTSAISGSAETISKLERAKASDPNSQVAVAQPRHRLLPGDPAPTR